MNDLDADPYSPHIHLDVKSYTCYLFGMGGVKGYRVMGVTLE